MENTKTLTFEFSVDEANIVLAGLQELPARIANPLTQKIQQQAKAQLEKEEGEKPESNS